MTGRAAVKSWFDSRRVNLFMGRLVSARSGFPTEAFPHQTRFLAAGHHVHLTFTSTDVAEVGGVHVKVKKLLTLVTVTARRFITRFGS